MLAYRPMSEKERLLELLACFWVMAENLDHKGLTG